jgi:hypothetical protein
MGLINNQQQQKKKSDEGGTDLPTYASLINPKKVMDRIQ